MQIAIINRRDNRQYWIDKYGSITGKFNKALKTTDVEYVSKLVLRYVRMFRVIVVNKNGEVIRYYS